MTPPAVFGKGQTPNPELQTPNEHGERSSIGHPLANFQRGCIDLLAKSDASNHRIGAAVGPRLAIDCLKLWAGIERSRNLPMP